MADADHAQATRKETDHDKEVDNAKNQNQKQKSNACRRLDFGNENVIRENEVNKLLCLSAEDMHEQRQRAIEKWNFDFENEVPLDGDWEWEKIPVQSTETKEVVSSMEKKYAENRTV